MVSVGKDILCGISKETIGEQPAAEARKAEGASMVALRIPSPPELTGKEACSQEVSDSVMLQIAARKEPWTESKDSRSVEVKCGGEAWGGPQHI